MVERDKLVEALTAAPLETLKSSAKKFKLSGMGRAGAEALADALLRWADEDEGRLVELAAALAAEAAAAGDPLPTTILDRDEAPAEVWAAPTGGVTRAPARREERDVESEAVAAAAAAHPEASLVWYEVRGHGVRGAAWGDVVCGVSEATTGIPLRIFSDRAQAARHIQDREGRWAPDASAQKVAP